MASSVPAKSQSGYGEILGTVLAVQANFYRVRLDGPSMAAGKTMLQLSEMELLCTRRARLKKVGQQVMVGDRVRIEEPDWVDGRGAIAQVAPRHTLLDRPPIANADQILLVFAIAEPDLDCHQLTRFLVKAESTGLKVGLCLNKQDLVAPSVRQAWASRIRHWGYEPLLVSVAAEQNLIAVAQQLGSHVTVVSGPSGVGKSSLINYLIPDASLRTGTVSGKLGRGRHTTRHVELFELPTGGFLADTPGFNQPDLTMSPEALASCFPEIRQRQAQQSCQFSDCLHRDEPGCVVRGAWERYELYLAMLEEAISHQESLQQQRDPEASFKIKTTEAGELRHEPRLQAKKYRQISRRSRKQALQDLCDDLTQTVNDLDDLDELDDLDLDEDI